VGSLYDIGEGFTPQPNEIGKFSSLLIAEIHTFLGRAMVKFWTNGFSSIPN
jgi:hypothetical protein